VIRDSAGGSRIFDLRGPMMVARNFRPATMKTEVWKKDMTIIGAFAREVGAPTPLFDASSAFYLKAIADGLGDADTAAVYQVLEGLAGS
jgi:3-hydroxyisobutyrate dehydrogenase-like beta-hydroxyacid dehydrogenase